ncbi:MAG: hypothetical protein IPK16_29180 [Anaerolineales bacterium]|nr:hypothetical protein [Anaerolineales bacterium]
MINASSCANCAANGQLLLSPDEFARLKSKHEAAIRQLTNRDYMAEQTDGSFRMRIGFFFDWLYAWEDFDRELERQGSGETSSRRTDP